MKYLLKNKWFSLVVILPVLVATLYYSLIASDEYVSESRFVVKTLSRQTSTTSTLANLIQTTGLGSGQEQTSQVLSYVKSRDALADLSRSINVRNHFARPDVDIFSRYPGPFWSDTFENLYKYYNGKVETRMDSESGLAVVSVIGFTAQDAAAMNARLLDLSEALVNRLNQRAREQAITEGERRVLGAEDRVRRARLALAAYRNREGLLDPAKQAAGVLDISNRLVAERAALQAQLDLMQSVAPRNPAIPTITRRIEAIGREIDLQTGRAVGSDKAISSKLANYERLALEQEFAAANLTAANAALEQARAESQRQQYYLERVVEPNTPDMPLLPHRMRQILTVAGTLLCLYFIGWMLIVGILEHAPDD